jgi:hypothetical protein
MNYLGRIRQLACSLDVDGFVMAHDGLCLLGIYPEPDEDESDSCNLTSHGRPWSGFLRRVGVGAKAPDSGEATEEQDELQRLGLFLLRIEKSQRNPWKGRISLERATNNDLVIRHPSISKLHAHFILESGRSDVGPAAMTLQLADAGSKNGTRKNGQKLPSGELRATFSGDVLDFGDVRCELYDAAALYEQIRRRLPTPELRESTKPGG